MEVQSTLSENKKNGKHLLSDGANFFCFGAPNHATRTTASTCGEIGRPTHSRWCPHWHGDFMKNSGLLLVFSSESVLPLRCSRKGIPLYSDRRSCSQTPINKWIFVLVSFHTVFIFFATSFMSDRKFRETHLFERSRQLSW